MFRTLSITYLISAFVLWQSGANTLTLLFAISNILHPWINLKVDTKKYLSLHSKEIIVISIQR